MRNLATLHEQVPALSLDAALGCDLGALFDLERSAAVFEHAIACVDDAPVTELLAMLTLFADALATSTLHKVMHALVACAAHDRVPLARRQQVADTLSLVAPADALSVAVDAWLSDPAPERRALAVRALARPRAYDRVPRVARALDDADPDVVVEAAAALGTIGGRDAARALAAPKRRPEVGVRLAISRALARIDDGGRVAREALFERIDDADGDVRLAAIRGLIEHHRLGSLAAELVDDSDPRVRVLVAAHLAGAASDVSEALLQKLARDPDVRVSRAALRTADRREMR